VPMFLSFQALRNQGQMVPEVSLAHLSPLKRENINLTGDYTGEESWLVGAFRLPRDDGVRFPDRAAFIAGSFQAFVCDLRPKLLQRPRCRLVRMAFGVVRSPRHPPRLSQMTGIIKKSEAKMSIASVFPTLAADLDGGGNDPRSAEFVNRLEAGLAHFFAVKRAVIKSWRVFFWKITHKRS